MDHVIEKLRIKIERITERSIDYFRVGGADTLNKIFALCSTFRTFVWHDRGPICLNLINITQDVRPE